jgi:ubiquinone/menaquinone biosynthesis C-methylase UbiE
MPTMSTFEQAFCRSGPWGAFARRVVLPWALQGLRPRGELLEIGAGSGAMAAELLAAYPDVRMTVTDYDEAMVAAAERLLAPAGERATLGRADATALPFVAGRFDAVLSVLMLHHVVVWEQALAEAVRVLRPGGLIVVADLLANAPLRLLHQAEGADFRLLTLRELRSALTLLPLDEVTVRPGVARFTIRFTARKQPSRAG